MSTKKKKADTPPAAPPGPTTTGFVEANAGPHKIYGYIRVSSDKQTVENQRFEVRNFCKARNMEIDGWIAETISGTKNYDKRNLGKLLQHIEPGDLIICAELSRLGRNLFMVMEILNICIQKQCAVWTIKDNFRLGTDIQSKVLAFAFGLAAEIERNLISQRTKQALARLVKEKGIVVGRPKGRVSDAKCLKLYGHNDLLIDMLSLGISKHKMSAMLYVYRNTLDRYFKRFPHVYEQGRHLFENPEEFPDEIETRMRKELAAYQAELRLEEKKKKKYIYTELELRALHLDDDTRLNTERIPKA